MKKKLFQITFWFFAAESTHGLHHGDKPIKVQ